jgi:hypothetical protein
MKTSRKTVVAVKNQRLPVAIRFKPNPVVSLPAFREGTSALQSTLETAMDIQRLLLGRYFFLCPPNHRYYPQRWHRLTISRETQSPATLHQLSDRTKSNECKAVEADGFCKYNTPILKIKHKSTKFHLYFILATILLKITYLARELLCRRNKDG